MGDYFASGSWHVAKGKEGQFIDNWTEFLGWTRREHSSLVRAGLIRDEGDPGHFISFAEWNDGAARKAWKEDPGFAERFSACRSLCNDFYGGDYSRLIEI